MLKYAETDKRGRAMEKAFLEVSKSFLFYIISKWIELYSSTISGHFTGHMIFLKAKQSLSLKKVTLSDFRRARQQFRVPEQNRCLIFLEKLQHQYRGRII